MMNAKEPLTKHPSTHTLLLPTRALLVSADVGDMRILVG